jgi:hypothetical protein
MPAMNEDLYSTFGGSYQKVSYPGGSVSGFNVSLPSLQRYVRISSVKTTGFRTRKKKHKLPINAYSKEYDVVSSPPAVYGDQAMVNVPPSHPWWALDVFTYKYNASVFFGGNPTVVFEADDPFAKAINDLMSKLTDSKTNTMVTAAEMHKTVKSVAKTATRLYTSIRALKHGDFFGFTTALGITSQSPGQKKRFDKKYARAKSADAQDHHYSDRSFNTTQTLTRMSSFQSETWLEYKYAWKPLLKDVFDHAKALAELNIDHANVLRAVSGKGSTTQQGQRYVNGGNGGFNFESRSEVTRFCKVKCWYALQNGQLNTFIQLGIDNPMEVAWEIVPFSFVADWFIPIGEYLKNLTATNGLTFYAGVRSDRYVAKCEQTTVANGRSYVSGLTKYGPTSGSGKATREILRISRRRLDEWPGPVFPGFRDPRDTKDGGISRATSAIALLQSLFLKQKSSPSKYL